MPRDDVHPRTEDPRAGETSGGRTGKQANRVRAALFGLGTLFGLCLAWLAYRQVIITPGNAQTIIVSRGGTVTRIVGPGQWAFLNPFSDSSLAYDMAVLAADRSAPDRGMPALSAEGHPLTVFGTAFWREGSEEDLRWRYAHIRAGTDMLQPLMAASAVTVMGRHPMDEIVRDNATIARELAEDLKGKARAMLRIDVTAFAVTRVETGDSYRAVVTEREMGRARAASVAASPAVTADNVNALELERIRRWDGRGIMPDDPPRVERRAAAR